MMRVCEILQNEPLKRKENISLEDNKFPKGLNPLERSFSFSDVGNKKEKEEESKKNWKYYLCEHWDSRRPKDFKYWSSMFRE
jgi:hypothetical protein